MMTNLFSTFDPSTNLFNLSLNWTSTFIGLLMIPSMFWFTSSRINIMWNKMNLTLHNEFKTLLGTNSFNGTTFIFISIFIMMLFNNFMGLFPYIFTSTSHLTLTLTIALPLWLSFMLFGWINHTNHMFTHLVPQGTPPALMSFMVLIETVSNIIRPGTLAVRLAANINCSTPSINLISKYWTIYNNKFNYNLNYWTNNIINSSISSCNNFKAYVFSILSTLYSSEVY
uniref:ATP synthase F0 subunit 6 n=1 Tax=Phlaeoba antennata TaxID=227576 RepID=UPI001F12B714|nr:ATP synthase F0 subunit 6 [Phlaeoba antennata]ATO88584.1 ATP synthase F0 subunit 6 [Phlaeoba antennata]